VTCFWPDCGGSVYRGCIGCEGDGRENKAAHRTADAGKVRICGMVPEFEAKKQPSPLMTRDDLIAEIKRLRTAIRAALALIRNPHDGGGEFEDGEVGFVDVLRNAVKMEQK
jgi:hypothetical protein